MTTSGVTLFSWGYRGWGNATGKLVEAADAVERSRGRSPPVFVDIRVRRAVRAEGFRDNVFGDLLGRDRYRWLKGLGNRSILEGGGRPRRLVDAAQAEELLDLALESRDVNRRLIFFCSCATPLPGCHRHWIAPELFEAARKRDTSVTVVEWPGLESASEEIPRVTVEPKVLRGILSRTRKYVPLPGERPPLGLLGLPWLEIVELVGGKSRERVVSGPAQFRAGAWQLPVLLAGVPDPAALLAEKRARAVLPLTGP